MQSLNEVVEEERTRLLSKEACQQLAEQCGAELYDTSSDEEEENDEEDEDSVSSTPQKRTHEMMDAFVYSHVQNVMLSAMAHVDWINGEEQNVRHLIVKAEHVERAKRNRYL
jgi:hypothetical protein